MSLKFIPITKQADDYERVIGLYKTAFPARDRLPTWFLNLRAKRDYIEFHGIYHAETWLGFMYVLTVKDMVYVAYFAIDRVVRSGGYGSKALVLLKDSYPGKRIVLDIEVIYPAAENYEQRVRRKQFYLKNGYRETGFWVKDSDFFEVLILGESVSKAELVQLYQGMVGKPWNRFFASMVRIYDYNPKA